MEPDQAGAVESPGSLLPHRSVPGLPGLHGFFSGDKRRATPTRRERVEQESTLLWTVSRSLLLPYPLVLPPASTPIEGGLWPPGGLSRLRR